MDSKRFIDLVNGDSFYTVRINNFGLPVDMYRSTVVVQPNHDTALMHRTLKLSVQSDGMRKEVISIPGEHMSGYVFIPQGSLVAYGSSFDRLDEYFRKRLKYFNEMIIKSDELLASYSDAKE